MPFLHSKNNLLKKMVIPAERRQDYLQSIAGCSPQPCRGIYHPIKVKKRKRQLPVFCANDARENGICEVY